MFPSDRRALWLHDRRSVTRGGRRPWDRAGRHPIVLIADSYAPARTPCASYLDHHGFLAIEAASTDEALTKLHGVSPHAIVSGLDDDDARRFYERLSRDAAWSKVPIVVMAADCDMPMPPVSATILAKPFRLHALLRQLREVFRASRPST
ncbi:MAG: hypothetical protein ACRD2I_06360 [Vicinamibacterales bacterium]